MKTMINKIIALDLGTGGNKAFLYDLEGTCLASAFEPYPTQYPQIGWHEQRPTDWWKAVVESIKKLVSKSQVNKDDIIGLGISGHSLGAVPIDKEGNLLRDETPIWSDIRAQAEVGEFFAKVDPDAWYMATGNGFPAACYTIFKVMWYKRHEPQMFDKVYKILGTKDYINFRLTGKYATDFSYASGTGIYDLQDWKYHPEFIAASGMPASIWPETVPSTQVVGKVSHAVASQLGLGENVKVVCGGVDNSCMALGARNIRPGRVYTSLGSSAWIAVSSDQPVLDKKYKPYVFTHVIPGMFTSAVSIFSAGTSFAWVRDNICADLVIQASKENQDVFELMNQAAEQAPAGSHGLLFNPSLAGGTSQDPSVNMRGAYLGLDLKHGRPELIRAAIEGIAMNLRLRLDLLHKYTHLEDDILFVGGGAKSRLFLSIFADVFNTRIIKTTVDQDAAGLGAAALTAVGCGAWPDFEKIDRIQEISEVVMPDVDNNARYEQLLLVFAQAVEYQARISDALQALNF